MLKYIGDFDKLKEYGFKCGEGYSSYFDISLKIYVESTRLDYFANECSYPSLMITKDGIIGVMGDEFSYDINDDVFGILHGLIKDGLVIKEVKNK